MGHLQGVIERITTHTRLCSSIPADTKKELDPTDGARGMSVTHLARSSLRVCWQYGTGV